MIIESLDLLKSWLAKQLEPICDADPTALAKYVIALVKKDKAEGDLKALCEDQLDVFLGTETKLFVSSLFEVLQDKSYIPPVTQASNNVTNDEEQKGKKRKSFEEAEKTEVDKVVKTDNKQDVGKISDSQKNNNSTNNSGITNSDRTSNNKNINENGEISNDISNAKNKNELKQENLEINKDMIIERKDLDDVSMRGVSQDRSMKSVSPAVRSSKHGHSSRRRSSRSPNRSSSSRHSRSRRSRREHRDRSRERRSSRKDRREKEKCRDYEEKGICMLGESCPFDHGYDPVEVDDRNLPQMFSLTGLPPSSQPPTQPVAQPLQIYPNILTTGARPLMAPVTGALTLNTGLTTVQVQKPRPIPSPVENPRAQVPIFRPRNPIAFMRNISPPVTPATPLPTGGVVTPARLVAPQPGVLPQPQAIVPPTQSVVAPVAPGVSTTLSTTTSTVPPTTLTPSTGEPYNPEEPSIEIDEVDKTKTNENNETKTITSNEEDNRSQNELVQIAMGNVPLTPIVGSQPSTSFQFSSTATSQQFQQQQLPVMQQQMLPNPFVPDILQQTQQYMPINLANQQYQQQLQLQQQQQQQQQHTYLNSLQQQSLVQVPVQQPYRKNNVLEIRKIPKELNTIAKISEHFQKFGTITKIQTPFENDTQGALIEFSHYKEATAAYSSPEAIFGNRFIKVFWYNPNRNQTSSNGGNNKTNTGDSSQKETTVKEVKPKKVVPNAEQLRYVNPKADTVEGKMERKKELDKLKAELAKKKQTHYEELLKKQKTILGKLQDKGLSKEEKARLLKAFKACDSAVVKVKKEIMADTLKAKASNTTSPVKAFKDPKKEILDREIDIYHGNLQGEELLEAKKSLEQLKREMYSSRGRGGYRGRGRGRGSWSRGRGRGRGGFSTSVDNRPKQILVSGYDPSEKDAIVSHFTGFGQLDRIEETAVDKMVLTFPTRKSAEIAAVQGAEFNGKTLVLAWFTGHIKSSSTSSSGPQIQRRVTRSLSQSIMEKDLDDELLELDKEEEEMLLAGVDDDDDDDGNSSETNERSWRR